LTNLPYGDIIYVDTRLSIGEYEMEEEIRYECVCKRCGWRWFSKYEHPIFCPGKKCHSAYWNEDRSQRSTSDNRVNKDIGDKQNG
jgi:hypothetical protein